MDMNTSGIILLSVMVACAVLAIGPIRRWFWNFFVFMHIALFVAMCVFAVLHQSGVILIGAAVWGLDILIRYLPNLSSVISMGGFPFPFSLLCETTEPLLSLWGFFRSLPTSVWITPVEL